MAGLTELERAAPWIRCHHCEDFWCLVHRIHVFECSCSPVEEWTASPYLDDAAEGLRNG